MFVRIPSASSSRWGRFSLVLGLGLLPAFASCANSEDTEPFVPSMRGANQPNGSGDLISEDDACERLRSAALAAYEDLGCVEPEYPACPGFLRPAGGSGCYEYREGSVASCEREYEDATSCSNLAPCLATAELNLELPSCEQVTPDGMAGAGGSAGVDTGGAGAGGGAGQGGAPIVEGGGPSVAGQGPQAGAAGDASGGAPP
jgi:hypothetical protein